jgi:hypothetical protein
MNALFRRAVCAAAFFACASAAQASGIGVEANAARAGGIWGGELGLAYTIKLGGFALRPVVGGFIYQGDNDRYLRETIRGGRRVCRDSTNGRFARDELCDNTAVKAYGKLEASYTIPSGPELGGGGRFDGDKVRPYGFVAIPVAEKLRIRGNVGDGYYAAGLNLNF